MFRIHKFNKRINKNKNSQLNQSNEKINSSSLNTTNNSINVMTTSLTKIFKKEEETLFNSERKGENDIDINDIENKIEENKVETNRYERENLSSNRNNNIPKKIVIPSSEIIDKIKEEETQKENDYKKDLEEKENYLNEKIKNEMKNKESQKSTVKKKNNNLNDPSALKVMVFLLSFIIAFIFIGATLYFYFS